MRTLTVIATFLAAALVFSGCRSRLTKWDTSADPEAVAAALDDFHDAASAADEARYFAHFAQGGVFIGTDATERWTVEEFRAYAHPYFSQGKGWTYRATSRHVDFSQDGRTAWFDEMLFNEKWGVCRGSGVLVRGSSAAPWKIAQYNLSVPIPNDLLPEFADRIRALHGQKN